MGKSKPQAEGNPKPPRDGGLVTILVNLLWQGNDPEALLRRALAEGILMTAMVRLAHGPDADPSCTREAWPLATWSTWWRMVHG
jgi:hypothetical protein